MSEVERIAELEGFGYVETSYSCPECGTNLMERVESWWIDGYEVEETLRECPFCGWDEATYDD